MLWEDPGIGLGLTSSPLIWRSHVWLTLDSAVLGLGRQGQEEGCQLEGCGGWATL